MQAELNDDVLCMYRLFKVGLDSPPDEFHHNVTSYGSRCDRIHNQFH